MALFIANLAFPDSMELQNIAKLGILMASAVAAIVGITTLYFVGATKRTNEIQ